MSCASRILPTNWPRDVHRRDGPSWTTTGFTNEVAKVLLAASPTMQEAFMTSIRVRLAERRGREFLERRWRRSAARRGTPPGRPARCRTAGIDATGLTAQFAFLNEADRLKSVLRATTLADGSRPENSGEHYWHLALYALVLADQAGPGVNIDRVIRMLLAARSGGNRRGRRADPFRRTARPMAQPRRRPPRPRAADRIFGLLPADLGHRPSRALGGVRGGRNPRRRLRQIARPGAAGDGQPACGGGTWIDLQRDRRPAGDPRRRARSRAARPALWDWVRGQVRSLFFGL